MTIFSKEVISVNLKETEMKKTILLPLLFVLSFVFDVFSQEYHPLLNNSSWIIYDWVSCCRPPIVKFIPQGTDVEVGGYTYKKFIDPFAVDTPFVYLREDVATKKVYKIVNGVDALLYDFNLQTGDVILQYGNTFTATVDTITLNNGMTRKRIKLASDEQYCGSARRRQTWIEGVGSDSHPFYPQHNGFIVCSAGGGWRINTRCSFQGGEHIYGESDCPELMDTMLGLGEFEDGHSQIRFFPNPVSAELNIESDTAFIDARIMLYNSIGQLVRESSKQSGNRIVLNRGQLGSGLYFVQLYEQEKLVKTAEIMVNK